MTDDRVIDNTHTPRVADRIPHVEQTARRLMDCPVEGCDTRFVGWGEQRILDHVATEHEEFVHPHGDREDVTERETLYRLSQMASSPVSHERPAEDLPPRLVWFLDNFLIPLVLAGILLVLGWPVLVSMLFG